MITDLLDALFCPVHGIFRPSNLVIAVAMWDSVMISVNIIFDKIRFKLGVYGV